MKPIPLQIDRMDVNIHTSRGGHVQKKNKRKHAHTHSILNMSIGVLDERNEVSNANMPKINELFPNKYSTSPPPLPPLHLSLWSKRSVHVMRHEARGTSTSTSTSSHGWYVKSRPKNRIKRNRLFDLVYWTNIVFIYDCIHFICFIAIVLVTWNCLKWGCCISMSWQLVFGMSRIDIGSVY